GGQGPGPPPPGVALQVFGRVQADPEDPGPPVAHLRKSLPRPPALQKSFLGGVLGVLVVAQEVIQGAHQLGTHLVQRADELISGGRCSVHVRRPHRGAHCQFAHTITPFDEWAWVSDWGPGQKVSPNPGRPAACPLTPPKGRRPAEGATFPHCDRCGGFFPRLYPGASRGVSTRNGW